MWKYIDTGETGAKGEEIAATHFNVLDPACPVVETKIPGRFAVWCAAPLGEADEYPLLHHPPAEKGSPFSHIKSKRNG